MLNIKKQYLYLQNKAINFVNKILGFAEASRRHIQPTHRLAKRKPPTAEVEFNVPIAHRL